MGYGDRLIERRRETSNVTKPCECWDCLRKVGITPQRVMRDRHKRLYPQTIMQGRGIDIPRDGRHIDDSYKDSVETGGAHRPHRAADEEFNRSLREAIKNREVM